MKGFAALQRRLGWKLLLSYLVILAVDAVVLAGFAALQTPDALAGHIARVQAVIGSDPALAANLTQSFLDTIFEILLFATGAAVAAAVIVSTFTARRIVGPLEEMVQASGRIASGDYGKRVPVPGEDELGQLVASFNHMAETLERTEARRMELIGDVAHELRTPLTSIRTMLEGLIDGVVPAEAETYQRMQREVARLQRLGHDLEELSRAEAGQIPLELHPVAPSALARGAAERLEPQFVDKRVSLTVDTPADLPHVRADTNRITQVLLNLLGNALQYTPDGGRVILSARQEGGMVAFSVHDTGIGIPAEHLPHVFERFYRVDKSRSRTGGGSGIGLTIARHLVEAHGGHISVSSAGAGQGSTFTFTLPLAT
jgi:signal transduction histidine kinase